jgi:chromate transporter
VPLFALKALALQATPSAALLLPLTLVFLKIGLLMFGGGLVVAPLMQQELVDGPHWLTTRQLVDGLALGQLTPGPVSVVATFAGFAVAGFPGGIVATVAVFFPSFVLVLGLTPLLLRRYRSTFFISFLRGVTAGALGTIAGAAILFGRAAITDMFTAAIALISLALLLRWNLNTTYLILGAAVLGIGRALLGL